MSGWNYSVVIIVPASLQDKSNRLSCALGYDELPGNTFAVPLSLGGSEPATHYGCRTWAKQEFIDIMIGADAGTLPAIDWSDFGVTPADIATIVTAQVFDVRDASEAMGHFDIVIADHGLKQIDSDLSADPFGQTAFDRSLMGLIDNQPEQ